MYLLQHPENVDSRSPETYVHSKRMDAAVETFNRKYAGDPVWLYFTLRNDLITLLQTTVPQFSKKYIHRDPEWDDAYDKAKELYLRLLALEDVIIKKYQK